MKIKICYELDYYNEKEELKSVQNAFKNVGVSNDLDNFLRNKLKYSELSNDAHDAFYEAREYLNNLRYE